MTDRDKSPRDTGTEGDKGHGKNAEVGRPTPQKGVDNTTPREAPKDAGGATKQ